MADFTQFARSLREKEGEKKREKEEVSERKRARQKS
jgi:hypothetical protein